ncbi:DUF2461 domain-containing protein [Brevundimonas sp. GCM10030266]|uniref:DUF2461 domain-containing protein n=1 Tax=Brevundimonas sp. GCM10030266 TaxID=3273386 RepID=UPI0036211E41
MTFSGFAPADLAFLTGLAANNDRDWFAAHRAAYDDGLKPALAALIADTSTACAARDLPLSGDPKRSVFRIHRDPRFSKDKRPYKTHVSCTLTRDGQKMSPGMMYIHIEPEGGSRPGFDPDSIDPLDPSTHPSEAAAKADDGPFGHGPFVACGFYLDERPHIDAVRRLIVDQPARWAAVEAALSKAGLTLDPGAPVKRMPKGFEDQAGTDLEPALKRTRWLVSRSLTGAEVASPALPAALADFALSVRPLLDFGWSALDRIAP